MTAKLLDVLKRRARQLKTEIGVIYLAYKYPRVPWYAKLIIACVIGYAFSPIDLIPDFIPIIGYFHNLILVPLGIALALKMNPPAVLAECTREGLSSYESAETHQPDCCLYHPMDLGSIRIIRHPPHSKDCSIGNVDILFACSPPVCSVFYPDLKKI